MRKRFLILAWIMLTFQHTNLFSQQVSFTPVTSKSDRDNYGFLGITQDRLGNIWLSSYDGGIYKYDGSGFVNFQHNDSISNSVASNHTEAIYADSTDVLWIGNFDAGLDKYDPLTNQFIHFRHNPHEATSLSNDTVTALLKDHEGNLWIGTYGGLDLFDEKAGTFKHFVHDPNNKYSLSSNSVRSLYEDRQGVLWIGCGRVFPNDGAVPEEGGLNRFNKTDGSFTQYKHEPGNPASLETNKVKALFEDSKGNFWVGTSGNGLHLMDRTKGTFMHCYYDSLHPEKLSRPPATRVSFDHITFIKEDILGGLWIGSYLSGINRYDTTTKKTNHYGKLANGLKVLPTLGADTSSGYVDYSSWNALFSTDGQIWFTSLNSSATCRLYRASVIRKEIPFYPTGKLGGANTFYYESDTVLWVGTDSGMIRKNLILNTEKIYRNEHGNPNSLSNNSVNVIRADQEKNLWLGTFGGGLNKFDRLTNHFTHFVFNSKIESSLRNDTIMSMCVDQTGALWIGTVNGLDRLDKQSGDFIHYKLENRNNADRGNLVLCMRADHNGQLWVGTAGGLYRVNMNTHVITTVLPSAITPAICVDSGNDIWIGSDTLGTGGKASLYRLVQNKFVLFADPNRQGAITDVIDIMEDRHQNLWVSTLNAIFRINDQRDMVRKFGSEYGVHKNLFGNGDNMVATNGKLFFGDTYGYYSFFPEVLKENSPLLLNFVSFKLNGQEVIPSESGILQKPVWRTDEIRLAHNENNFSFEFSGINYQIAGEIKYLYMLENYDNEWMSNENGRRAGYFNMPSGKYTLRVKAIAPDGAISEKSIRIIISPPWWKTWWAYIIFGALALGAVWGFIVYRSRKLLAENKSLEEKVTRRTEQLNLSLKELKSTQNQLIQSEKMASLGELTAGIAHEIQNPLNFVNNFSEINSELIAEMKEEIARGNIEEVKELAGHIEENEMKIVHHGRRADAIVKGMLQHSRTSNSVKEPTDLNKLVDEYLRLSYHGLRAKDKSFNADLQTDFDQAAGQIIIIPQDIGRVLLNLFNNAFYAVAERKKQQPDNYSPVVRVSTRLINQIAEIKVSDNGNGIPQKILGKIYQPFFTTKPTGQGTGLGLSLSYDIIKAHSGEMKVETKEGEGAAFVILLPVG